MAPLPSQGTGSEPTALQKVADWASANRRPLLVALGVTTAVAGGAGYYYYASSAAAKKELKKAKKASKKKGKKASAPLKKEGSEVDEKESVSGNEPAGKDASATAEADPSSQDPLLLSKEDLQKLPPSERSRFALDLKNRGNKAYQAKSYTEAIDLYTKAIECEEQAVFYSNRAACYSHMNNEQAVIQDCTEALRLDKTYIKALNRRAAARESLGGEDNLFEALCDFTACVILDEFKTDSKGQLAEKVMRRYASEKAARIVATREPRLPSPMIVRAYLDAFRKRDRPMLPQNPSQGDGTLNLAIDALEAFDYSHALVLFTEAATQGVSRPDLEAYARTMKATFLFLMGTPQTALEELDQATSLHPQLVQAWVKKASVHMELGRPDEAMADFAKAEEVDKEDADVYYHRGQVFNVTDQHEAAIGEYKKSAALEPGFIFSHVQLAVAYYKAGSVERALRLFKKYQDEYGESAEVHNYYGELLFAEKQMDEAVKQFERAMELEAVKTGPKNVLPLVNKAMVLAQGKGDLVGAEELCAEAVKQDSTCEAAVQQLAQLKLAANKIPEAVKWFGKGAELAMSEPSLASFLQFEAAAKAQLSFVVNYPEQAARFGLSLS